MPYLWKAYNSKNNIKPSDIINYYQITNESDKQIIREIFSENSVITTQNNIYNKLSKQGLFGFDNTGSSDILNDDTYRGQTVNSEDEIKNFQSYFIENNRSKPFDAYISLHSFTNDLIVPTRMTTTYPSPFFTHNLANSYTKYIDLVNTQINKYYKNDDIDNTIHKIDIGINDVEILDKRDDHIYYSTAIDSIGYPVNGTMDEWTYLIKQSETESKSKSKSKTTDFKSITLEVGNIYYDGFYPNKYEMVDIIFVSVRSLALFISNI